MTPKEECEAMMDELIGSAEELLVQDGEFHPFAAMLSADGQIQRLVPTPPGPGGLVAHLAASLKARAAEPQPQKAACIVSLVSVQRPGTQEVVDAIRMALDHQQDYAAHVFFPYELRSDHPGKVIYGEPFSTRGVSFAFRCEPYPG